MQAEGKSLLTIREAADFLRVSASTLYGWVWQRRIPFVKVGRALRFERCDLEKFLQANRYEARNHSRAATETAVLRKIRDAAGKG